MKKIILKIGLTGNIGSGKTTVAHFFKTLRVPITDADKIAKKLTKPNTPLFKKIVAHFGKDILKKNHTLNRKKLRDIIFNHPDEKKWLEHCLHPAILKTMKKEIASFRTPYCICVIPLLREKKINWVDRVLVVDSPLKIKIKRAMLRDQTTQNKIKAILKSQVTSADPKKYADDILKNNGNLKQLKKRVKMLHQLYLQLSIARY